MGLGCTQKEVKGPQPSFTLITASNFASLCMGLGSLSPFFGGPVPSEEVLQEDVLDTRRLLEGLDRRAVRYSARVQRHIPHTTLHTPNSPKKVSSPCVAKSTGMLQLPSTLQRPQTPRNSSSAQTRGSFVQLLLNSSSPGHTSPSGI